MTSDVRDMSATRIGQRQELDTETAAVVSWLLGVCRRSDLAFDQVFIFRRPSLLGRILRFHLHGEVKAIGMPDLAPVTQRQFHALRRLKVVVPTRGRWPGTWFKVNQEAVLSGDVSA